MVSFLRRLVSAMASTFQNSQVVLGGREGYGLQAIRPRLSSRLHSDGVCAQPLRSEMFNVVLHNLPLRKRFLEYRQLGMPLRLQLRALRAVRSCTSCISLLCAFNPFAESKTRSHNSQGCARFCWCAVSARSERTRLVASCNLGSLMAAFGPAYAPCCSSLLCSASQRFISKLQAGVSPHLSHNSLLVSRVM